MIDLAKKRKILFVTHDSESYETQMGLYWILRDLDRSRYDALVMVHEEGPLKRQIESLGWPVMKLQRIRIAKYERPPMHGLGERLTWWLWKRIRGRKVIQLISKEGIDLVHTNSIVCFEGAYAAYKSKRPHIWHVRELLPGNRRLFGVFGTRKTLKIVARFSSKVVCVSDTVKRQFSGWQRQPEKYMTITNSVDTDLFNPETTVLPAETLRKRFDIPDEEPFLAYRGPITHQRGFSDLVDACALLQKDGVLFRVVVLGEAMESRYMLDMQTQLDECGLTKRFHFLGEPSIEELPGYLKQMDIFVSPAHSEPFAGDVLEAMALGLPVVGTYSGGVPEVVVPHKTGLLAKTGTPSSLAQALRTLMEDSALRAQFGQAGQERVLSQFTIKHYTDQIYALYDELFAQ